jgi:hypothetical protein
MTGSRVAGTLAFVAASITSLVGIITIWGWISTPSSKLSATMTYSAYFYPPFQRDEGSSLPSPADIRRRLRAIWIVDVRNDGDLKSEAVSLKIPDARATRILWKHVDAEERRVDGVIQLGDIGPEENVRVLVWLDSDHAPSNWNGIRLHHAKGPGSIKILYPLGPFWQWVASWWIFILLALLWTVGAAVTFPYAAVKGNKRT